MILKKRIEKKKEKGVINCVRNVSKGSPQKEYKSKKRSSEKKDQSLNQIKIYLFYHSHCWC